MNLMDKFSKFCNLGETIILEAEKEAFESILTESKIPHIWTKNSNPVYYVFYKE